MLKTLQQIIDEADHIIGTEAMKHREIAIKNASAIKTLAKKVLKNVQNNPRLFVYVRGGVIQTVIADQKVEVMVLDGDVDGLEGEDIKTYKDTAKEMFNARKAWDKVEVSKKVVDHYFSQR
jgi:hypothetical protein